MSFKYFRILSLTFNTADESGGDRFQCLQVTTPFIGRKRLQVRVKSRAEEAIGQLFERKDLLAVWPTIYGKSLILSYEKSRS